MNKAVIFDMDGTVWDASKQIKDSWNVVFITINILQSKEVR